MLNYEHLGVRHACVRKLRILCQTAITVAQSSFSFLAFNIDSLVRSKTRKPRRMSFRGFSNPSLPFCTIPKTENSEIITSDFSLKHFDQTMSTLIKLPRFSSSEFFILHHTQNGKLGVGKTLTLIKIR